ncbi:MAG: hypothetical protein AMXMBFR33_23110 [Candidatus Xenobia bacterium]
MFAREEYQGLENLANHLRERPPEPVIANFSPLGVLYDALIDRDRIPFGWGGSAYRYRRWLKKRPESDVARHGYCRLITTALMLRKSNPADTSTDSLGPTDQAGQLADMLVGQVGRKDAVLLDTKLLIGAVKDNHGSQLELATGMFNQAHQLDPAFTEPYLMMTTYLATQELPRNAWCASLETRPEEYAQAFMTVKLTYNRVPSPFIYKEFLYPKLKPALLELQKKRPNSLYLANIIAWTAGLTKDYELAREQLRKIGRSPDPDVFKSTSEFMKLRGMAGVSEPDQTLPSVIPVGWEREYFPPPNSPDVLPYQWVGLLRQHRFLELEELARAYRKTPDVLHDFYASLGDFETESQPEQESRRDDLEAWTTERPDSSEARLALAQYWIHIGWKARGGGYANTVSRQAAKLFQERLDRASKAIEEASEQGNKDLALELTRISLYQGMGEPAEIVKAFKRATEGYPDRLEPYLFMVIPLLPRWYGEPGDLRELSDEAVKATRKSFGQGAAAVVGLNAMESEGRQLMDPTTPGHLDWRQVVQGMADLEARGKATSELRNQYFFRAVQLKDRAAAARAVEKVDPESYSLAHWGTREQFEAARAWARGQGPWREAPTALELVSSGLVDAKTDEVTNVKVVPCKKGSQMGVAFRFKGDPVRPIGLISTWSFPRMNHPQQGPSTQLQSRITCFPDEGPIFHDIFALEYPYELVKGNWEVELTDLHGEVLLRERYQVK